MTQFPTVILFGMPYSGKSTQANQLEKRIGLAHVKIGELIRTYPEERIDDNLVFRLLDEEKNRAFQKNSYPYFVLDGIPRSLSQIPIIEKQFDVVAAIYFQTSEEELRRRYELSENKNISFEDRLENYMKNEHSVVEFYKTRWPERFPIISTNGKSVERIYMDTIMEIKPHWVKEKKPLLREGTFN